MSTASRSLAFRLFLISGGLVLGAMLVALGATAWRAQAEARESAARALADARLAQARVERQQLSELRLMAQMLGGDPSFAAYVAAGDPASVRDLLLERQRELGVGLAAVLDPSGAMAAHTGRSGSTAAADRRIVRAALEQGFASGLWEEESRWWTAVVAPVVAGGSFSVGWLVLGFAIDDALAIEVRRQSGVEVAYVLASNPPRVLGATLSEPRVLESLLASERGMLEERGGVGHAPRRLVLAGRTWSVEANPLGGTAAGGDAQTGGAAPVVALTLASLDEALAPFQRIGTVLLAVGLVALVAAFALSWVLSRRLARPLEQLAAAADAARAGRYDLPVATSGSDEVGRLARAFDGLLTELREEREVQAWMQSVTRMLPEKPPGTPGPDALQTGSLLGERFEILDWIGAGGMGAVYRARDRELREVVALKTLHRGPARHALAGTHEATQATGDSAPDDDTLESLKRELRIARRITHRNVLRTHDFGVADGVAYISMEFVRGVTLRQLIESGGRVPIGLARRLAGQLLAGVDAAHALGIAHRDLKPENLMLEPTGLLRIMDFGIASMERGGELALEGLAGTYGYLAPEQFAGKTGDARSDLYACGVVLFEMLAGRRPYLAGTAMELVYQVTHEDPPDLRDLAPEAPPAFAAAVMRCLARRPEDRWPSADALARALEDATR